jgi:AcrR family transcriptional regulator
MPEPTDTPSADRQPEHRQRLIVGAADMLRRRGLAATSIRDLAKHTGAPLGSTYHYFPGGKEQLVTEAIQWAGGTYAHILKRQLERGPVAGLRGFIALWRQTIVDSDFRAGCPVLAVSVQEPAKDDAGVLPAAAQIFETWERLLAKSLHAHGASRRQSAQLATLIVASVEGTVVMCRAKRTTKPLDDIAPQLTALVEAATTHP